MEVIFHFLWNLNVTNFKNIYILYNLNIMTALNNGKPKLSSSDRTKNIANKNIYADTKSKKSNNSNYDGTIIYDTANNQIKSFRNYQLFMTNNYGYSLCDDCSGICPSTPADPDIQTENNQFSIIEFNIGDNLIDVGGADRLDAAPANNFGEDVFIDPDNILFGDSDCSRKNYLNYLKELSGIDKTGNDTNQNYLRCMTFPSKIKFY